MNIEQRSIEYLERLLAELSEIEQMSSPLKRLQAKMDLRKFFEEALQEGQESVKNKPEQIPNLNYRVKVRKHLINDRAPFSIQR